MHHPRHPTAAQERQWLDEVLHLHSLWRRGPPRNHPPPPSSSPPPPRSHPAGTAVSQNPENKINKRKGRRGRRKKEQSRQRRKEDRHQKQQQKVSFPAPDPPVVEEEWPCLPSPTSEPEFANWPNPVIERKPLLLSADDQARADAVRVQESGISASCEFFRKSSSSDDGDDDDEVEEDEKDVMEEDDDEEGDAEARAFRFFLGLFEKNGALRRYYEKNWEKGEFFCFVCRATGMKVGKRFLNCVGLVQHSKSISKTKRREAHRGFANAVCRVMGWDMERLPSIVLDLKDSLGQSLAKANKPQERICEGASFDMSKQVAEVTAVNVETEKEVVGSSPSRGIESLTEGQGMHEQSSSDIKEVVNTELNKQVPVSSSPLRDMEAFPEEGKHKDGPSKMTEEVPKEVVTKEGDQEDLTSSSPAGNMVALPEEEKIHEDGSSDMNKEITNEIVDVQTNKK
ncbi:Armadillo-like helical-containing protein [Dioscorea alata]|uniref:Armadillo-like helical-containing protein n=3 Tax=Dioscorea alata TaxID=55571 RepID=A0ACB7UBY9_DIOAL|nr:Armadillo-like helical-containing protein [Dioscorea alata]KAH7657783.1 Armadillo-like helical-containing protein [Dioscorea alata]KAH7657785.1 Armadillo-like helical-containing protein [Dioscorea alata]